MFHPKKYESLKYKSFLSACTNLNNNSLLRSLAVSAKFMFTFFFELQNYQVLGKSIFYAYLYLFASFPDLEEV